MFIDVDTPLRELLRRHPHSRHVLSLYGTPPAEGALDQSIERFCASNDLDPAGVLSDLEAVARTRSAWRWQTPAAPDGALAS